MSRAALPNKHPLSKRVVGASSTQAPEPALPPSPRRDPARGRAGVGGRERSPGGYVSPRAAQECGVAVGWREGGAITVPLPTTVPPSRPRRIRRRDASSAQPHGGTPGQGWGSRCGRLGRNVPGQAGKERQPRAQPQRSALARGPVGAARGGTKPPAPRWVQSVPGPHGVQGGCSEPAPPFPLSPVPTPPLPTWPCTTCFSSLAEGGLASALFSPGLGAGG